MLVSNWFLDSIGVKGTQFSDRSLINFGFFDAFNIRIDDENHLEHETPMG